VLALVGRHLPGSTRVLLLALAVADDIGGVVIAAVYSQSLSWAALGAAGGVLVAIVAL
jgi:NhaA family Na+:H+ antiporter